MATPVTHFQQQQQQQQPLPQAHIHHVQPAVTDQTCCGPFPKILAAKPRSAAYGIGIAILCVGIISLIIGIVGLFTAVVYVRRYYSGNGYSYTTAFNPTPLIGANIWCGIIYILCGIFGILSKKIISNPHLMNTYFAFAIISFILTLPHFGVSLGFMVSQRYGYLGQTIWFNIVSLILSIVAFALSMASIIILGSNIYCKNHDTEINSVHYQGGNQVVTIQRYPNQYPTQVVSQYPTQPVMAYQPTMPVYAQTTPTGHYTVNTNQTAIVHPDKSSLPANNNAPNQQGPTNQS